MITSPTVLILGAGASRQLGFPTGRELLDLIVSQTIQPQMHELGRLLLDCDFDEPEISIFG